MYTFVLAAAVITKVELRLLQAASSKEKHRHYRCCTSTVLKNALTIHNCNIVY